MYEMVEGVACLGDGMNKKPILLTRCKCYIYENDRKANPSYQGKLLL